MENKISLRSSDDAKFQSGTELLVSQRKSVPQQKMCAQESKSEEHAKYNGTDNSDSDNPPLFHDYTSGRLVRLDNFSFADRSNHFDSHANTTLRNKHEEHGNYEETSKEKEKSDKHTVQNYNNEHNTSQGR